ncbi:MAG: hypothetical protein JSS63_14925 [Bacteroidetes bacterium]|nr:hypothetical protein [Bacteroidota bacterium]
MRKYLLLTIAFFFSICASQSFAQAKRAGENRYPFISFYWFSEKPTIELSYGISEINLGGINTDFKKPGMIELHLGYSNEFTSKYSKNVIRYDNDYLFLSNATTDVSSQKNSAGINSSLWRFGFGNKDGTGLKFGSFTVMPYNANSFTWSRFSFDKSAALNPADYDKFDNFNEAFRFGTSAEAGINLQITKGFSLQPKYEVSDIFPRHLFGQQMVSSLIELCGAEVLDEFTGRIMKNTPVAGTVVNFVLKSAYEFGIYQLRKEHMNWPFTNEAPLRYSTFKMGMTFTF